MKWELYTRKDRRTGIRLKGLNGEVVLQGEGYATPSNARRALRAIAAAAGTATIDDLRNAPPKPRRKKASRPSKRSAG